MKTWDDMPLHKHANFAIGMLLASVALSLALLWSGRSEAGVMVGGVFVGAAIGSLIKLRQRLAPPAAASTDIRKA